MNVHDYAISKMDYKVVPMPFKIICTVSNCQTYIEPGSPAKKYDGATYAHVVCPTSKVRRTAIHNYGPVRR